MDESKPSIPPSKFRSASEWTSADTDPPRAELAKSDELAAVERQSRSGQIEPCRNDFPDGPSVAVYYRNEEEVSEGFLTALSAMGVARIEPLPPVGKASRRKDKAAKTRALPYLPLCVFFLTACDPPASRSPGADITFDTAKQLDDFEFTTSGNGPPGEWFIIDHDAGRALAPIDTQASENRLSFAIYRPFSGRDAYVSTRFMTLSGKLDQTAGIFVRFRSADDYYAVGANTIENNVNLYRVVAGKRDIIGCMEVNVSSQAWHTLGIAARDDRLTVSFDGRELFVATDRRFPGPPGKVGLWTRADNMTWFESLKIGSLD
jgi:hypothetical protein